ncbi:MAG: fibronectin, partial [Verrucomicrobiaceae bacterium]|nr:fibronectin [Verrucomicrobiaceae bacterium]
IGYVRLKVSMDSDHNGTPEATSVTPVFAFGLHSLPVAQTTLSMPLLKTEVFAGTVKSVTSSTLDVSGSVSTVGLRSALVSGRAYYLEVFNGTSEGLRIELDETATTDRVIAVESGSTVPAGLAGSRLVVRAHQTLNDLLPPSLMHASDAATTADRVMFFNGNAYEVKWLSNASGQARWVTDGDATGADVGSRVIGPAEGLMVQARVVVTLPLVGEVRANAFKLPLTTGARFIGGGWPVAQSPTSRDMTVAGGFAASTTAASADRIRIWLGDATPGATAYDSYFYFSAAPPQWTHEGDAVNASATKLFQPFHATFISTTDGAASWTLPRPFAP